jgi:hypothetical protein
VQAKVTAQEPGRVPVTERALGLQATELVQAQATELVVLSPKVPQAGWEYLVYQ